MFKARQVYFPLFISLVFVFIAIFVGRNFKIENNEKIIRNFQSTLFEKEYATNKILGNIYSLFDQSPGEYPNSEEIGALITEKDVEILVYSGDTLKYWSDKKIPGKIKFEEKYFKNGFSKFKNAYYEVIKFEKNEFTILGLILIKNEYPYQNKFLINEFQSDFNIPSGAKIESENKGPNKICDKNNKVLFSLAFDKKTSFSESEMFVVFTLFLLGLIFFTIFLFNIYKNFPIIKSRKILFALFFTVDLIIIKALIQYFQIPGLLYSSRLFNPGFFSLSFVFPSLGDLIVNAILILIIAYVFYISIQPDKQKPLKSQTMRVIGGAASLFFLFLSSLALGYLCKNIIVVADFSFNINDIYSLDIYSLTGFFVFAILNISFFLIAVKLCEISIQALRSYPVFLSITVIIFVVLASIFYYYESTNHIIILFAFVFCQIYWFFQTKEKPHISFSLIVSYLVVFSLLYTIILQKNNILKEEQKTKQIAEKLFEKRNSEAEALINEKLELIKNSNNIFTNVNETDLSPLDEEIIIKNIFKNFQDSFWRKYDILITICNNEKILNIQPENYLVSCNEYFEEILNDAEPISEEGNLFFCENHNTDNRKYIAFIEYFENREISPITIYIEFFSNLIPKGLGYPELLFDEENIISSNLSEYSYAKFMDGSLIYKFGNYQYSLKLDNYYDGDSIPPSFSKNKYDHRYFKIDENTDFILSKKSPDFLDSIAPFSYLLIFYSIVVLLFLIIVYFPFKHSIKKSLTFRNRLQFSIISIIVVSFLFIGTATLLYLIRLNDDKNHNILSEKAHSVLIELEHKLADEESLSDEMEEYLSSLLTKFSLVFFSDINLYDLDGSLIATSRSEIFDEGLISRKIDPNAFKEISTNEKILFIQSENIGKYEYLSAYVPFRNSENKPIAYLNLPYFARQNELVKEISTFLIAFFNIYVLLFAIAIFVTILISRFITKPLQLIKEKISLVKLGKSNEKINWKRNDEIGALISVYNRMIDEMGKSAELLAKSEREGAWREMAKQVAHEIKNPLTPMKLSAQYLQKAWDDKSPGWDKRLKNFTQTLTEQIDTLSKIASDFSDFAKIPVAKNEKIELIKILQNSIDLFKEYKKFSIDLKYSGAKNYFILGDKDQMLRVFNNLLKNSIQAMSHKDYGKIEIEISSTEEQHKIKLTDEGHGITKEQANKIFSPSFTTKSSGTGLGLSIVKSIITETGGEISFSSEKGNGTTFEIMLPKFKIS